jgi:hypothetical protein
LGSVKITHPFHPLFNQTFQVLKTRKIANIITLVLQHKERGSFAVPADWTDYFLTDQEVPSSPHSFISTSALIALCELVKKFE